MLFGGRYLCILCNRYKGKKHSLHISKGICICDRCMHKIRTSGDHTYEAKKPIEMLISPFVYEGDLRQAVKRLKFSGQRLYGEVFGKMIVSELSEMKSYCHADMIIPVPLHHTRAEERGYNQSEIIAKVVSDELGIPIISDAVFRIRPTMRQSGLPARDRVENVKEAFFASESVVHGKSVLLIDDICTMGETLYACSVALENAGAERITALTLCKTPRKERIVLR